MRFSPLCFLFFAFTNKAFCEKIKIDAVYDSIPMDSNVRTSRLPNGFTYFIRSHANPATRIIMFVTVKVGSADQAADQIEAAHLVEHMGLASTTNFENPVDFLQRSGLKMGKDANASTSFAETTYKIELPSGNHVLIDSCLLLLADVCQGVRLDPSLIDRERNVIIQEINRNAGVVQRLMDQYSPWLVDNATYYKNAGDSKTQVNGIKNLTYEAVRRFYRDWYQPALQALVVVGDIDADSVEKRVKTLFSGLRNSSAIPKRTEDSVSLTNQPRFLVVRDKEMVDIEVHVYDKRTGTSEKSLHDLEDIAASRLYDQLVSIRFSEVNTAADKKFQAIQHRTSRNGNLRNLDALLTSVLVTAGYVKDGVKAGLEEIERIKRYGFTQSELQVAKQDLAENRALRSTITSADLARGYQSVFLGSRSNFDLVKRDSIINSLIDKMTADNLNRFIKKWIDDKNRDILILAGEDVILPGEGEMSRIVGEVRTSKLKTHKGAAGQIRSVISSRKVPTEHGLAMLEKKFHPLIDVTEVKFRNGLRVTLKPGGGNGNVYAHGFRMVGARVYDSVEYPSAINAADIVQRSGAGKLNGADLARFEQHLGVSVTPYIYHNQTGIRASGKSKGLLAMVQLIYQFMVDPVVTKQGYSDWKNWKKNEINASEFLPRQLFLEKISGILGEIPVRKGTASISELDLVQIGKVRSFYRELFFHPSEFVFVITGDFEVDKLLPILSQYLGAVPEIKKYKDKSTPPLDCITPKANDFVIHADTKIERVSVHTVLEGHNVFTDKDMFDIKILGEAIQICLNKRLREVEAGTYGVTSSVAFEGNCDGRYRVNVSFDCSPDRVEGLMKALQQEIDFIKAGRVSESLVQSVKNQMELRSANDLKDSYFWLNYLSGQLRESKNVEAIATWSQQISSLTKFVFVRDVVPHLSRSASFRFFLRPETL